MPMTTKLLITSYLRLDMHSTEYEIYEWMYTDWCAAILQPSCHQDSSWIWCYRTQQPKAATCQ